MSDRYRAMLNKFLFIKIEEENIGNIWFQQDGATCHTAEVILDVLHPFFEADVVWPPWSCYWTLLDHYLWNAVKDKCYADKQEATNAIKGGEEHTKRKGCCSIQLKKKTKKKINKKIPILKFKQITLSFFSFFVNWLAFHFFLLNSTLCSLLFIHKKNIFSVYGSLYKEQYSLNHW